MPKAAEDRPKASRQAQGGMGVLGAVGLDDAVDLQILSLLPAGFTDTSVAKQPDMGLRTVQRRVKRLMELSGGTTRPQLGRHAYEKGWITRREAESGPGTRTVPREENGTGGTPGPQPGRRRAVLSRSAGRGLLPSS